VRARQNWVGWVKERRTTRNDYWVARSFRSDRLNATLRGWSNYFCQGDCYPAYRAVNQYVYECVRVFLRRRHKVPSLGTARYSDRIVFGKLGCPTSFRGTFFRALMVKSVGKPDALVGHVRVDEGEGNHRLN
jgi:hypothetical protein